MICPCGNEFINASQEDVLCLDCCEKVVRKQNAFDTLIVSFLGGSFKPSDLEITEILEQAKLRVNCQLQDIKNGNTNAGHNYNERGAIDRRNLRVRFNHALKGALAEAFAAKIVGVVWTKPIRQYNFSREPDLKEVMFKGGKVDADVRAASYGEKIPYRPDRDNKNPPDRLLITITNLSSGPICKAGWATFGKLQNLYPSHNEWLRTNKLAKKPYYEIPFSYYSRDFSSFK